MAKKLGASALDRMVWRCQAFVNSLDPEQLARFEEVDERDSLARDIFVASLSVRQQRLCRRMFKASEAVYDVVEATEMPGERV